MPRDLRAHENRKRARMLRDDALRRVELGFPTAPRTSPDGATSFPVKARDEGDDALIRAFLERKDAAK